MPNNVTEREFFIGLGGFTSTEYDSLKATIKAQHESSSEREDVAYCYGQLQTDYKDTYNFLRSLSDRRHEMGVYA